MSSRALGGWLGLLLLVGSASSVAAFSPAVAVANGPRTAREVALTFDDGSSPENCRRILAELVTAGVPATFFPIARAMQLDPAFWRLVAALGDPIGDHTLTHPQMPTLSYAAQVHQLQASRAIVEGVVGRPMLNVFRPPYGAWDETTLRAAAATGFPTVLTWDTSDRDTSPQGTLQEMQAAADRGTNGSVILLHCGPNATPYLVPSIIDHYRALGYRFVTVPQLLGLAWNPGRLATVTPKMILGSLTPLPDAPKGGPIVGPDGWNGPIPSPTPHPSARPSPSPSVAPATTSATPTRSAAPTAPATPSASATLAATAPIASATPAPAAVAEGRPPGTSSVSSLAPLVIAGALALAAVVAILLRGVFVAARGRSPDDAGGPNR